MKRSEQKLRRLILVIVGSLGLATSACGNAAASPAKGAHDTACQGRPVTVALGFERARVGQEELPMAILCDPSSKEPAPQATLVEARFSSPASDGGDAEREGEVVYRPGAHVLQGGDDQLRFDYVVKVLLDRAGAWTMRLRVRVPWTEQEANTTLTFNVDDEPIAEQ